jgi:hypothetical protein
MAKVIGAILSIIGGLAFFGTIFNYMNSSAYLLYNPSDTPLGLLDVNLMLPFVLFGGMLLSGVALLKFSKEPELK